MSIGEPPVVPTAAAIANAVHDAVGVRIKDLPITAEKVLSALKALPAEETSSGKHNDNKNEGASDVPLDAR